MSSVSAYKFHGSQIQVLVGFTADSPVTAITAITNANPAVVTDTGHPLADGDVVEITGVVGMTEVNSGRYVVEVIDANSFSLLESTRRSKTPTRSRPRWSSWKILTRQNSRNL